VLDTLQAPPLLIPVVSVSLFVFLGLTSFIFAALSYCLCVSVGRAERLFGKIWVKRWLSAFCQCALQQKGWSRMGYSIFVLL